MFAHWLRGPPPSQAVLYLGAKSNEMSAIIEVDTHDKTAIEFDFESDGPPRRLTASRVLTGNGACIAPASIASVSTTSACTPVSAAGAAGGGGPGGGRAARGGEGTGGGAPRGRGLS